MPYEEGITGEKGLQLIAQLDLQVEKKDELPIQPAQPAKKAPPAKV
jgi:hypothetical protein